MPPTFTRLTSSRIVGACCSCATQILALEKAKTRKTTAAANLKKVRVRRSVNPAIEMNAVCVLPGIAYAQMQVFCEDFWIDFICPGLFLRRIGFVRTKSQQDRSSSRPVAAGHVTQRTPVK